MSWHLVLTSGIITFVLHDWNSLARQLDYLGFKLDFCQIRLKKFQSELFSDGWSVTNQCPWRRKRRELQPGFSCDKNRKLLEVSKRWRPQRGCCNVVSFIRSGQHFIKRRTESGTKGFSLSLTGFGKSLAKPHRASPLSVRWWSASGVAPCTNRKPCTWLRSNRSFIQSSFSFF